MFITPEGFRNRLQLIKNRRCSVLPLGDAVKGLKDGTLPDFPTVITFDDGFYSCYAQAVPLLQEFGYTATFYITTYYVTHDSPVFRLAVQYLFWKSGQTRFDVGQVNQAWRRRLGLTDGKAMDATMWEIIVRAESSLTEEERQRLCIDLGNVLGVDFAEVKRKRLFSLFHPSEIVELARRGFDVQLHTHRHLFPVDAVGASKEIYDNQECLQSITGRFAEHFCYPSGVWSKQHWHILQDANVASATTCEPGLNSKSTSVFALRRIMESGSISGLRFDSELSGFAAVLRTAFCRKYRIPTASSSYGR
jgi:peptidoglycan/xylan/chitin deacetylase (PgdA/CDA1 family)